MNKYFLFQEYNFSGFACFKLSNYQIIKLSNQSNHQINQIIKSIKSSNQSNHQIIKAIKLSD